MDYKTRLYISKTGQLRYVLYSENGFLISQNLCNSYIEGLMIDEDLRVHILAGGCEKQYRNKVTFKD